MSELGKFKITLEWRVITLVVILLPVTLSLGLWQLDRAEEKRQLQRLFEQRQAAGPVAINTLNKDDDWQFQPVRLRGEFIAGKTLLLDNRIHRGQFGYEVVMPFRLADSDRIVLVNRGWVAGDRSRRSLPDIRQLSGILQLTGDIYVPQGKRMALATTPRQDWPRVLQSLDIESLQPEFDNTLFPYSVRLHPTAPAAFEPNWMVVNQQPEKHTGYAVQWFAMSVALVLIALLANTNLWALITRRQ